MSIRIVPQSIKRLFGTCPSEVQLAAYSEQQLIGDERNLVEQHLASCDACLQQVGFLLHTASVPSKQTPDHLLSMASSMGKRPDPITRHRWRGLAVATATGAVLAVVLWNNRNESRFPTPTQEISNPVTAPTNSAPEAMPVPPIATDKNSKLRGEQGSSDAMLTSPQPDEVLDASRIEFHWKPRREASFYEIKIVSETGDLVWQKRSLGSFLKLPSDVHLEKNKPYYVWMRIHNRRSDEQSSAVRFTVN